MDSAVQDYLRLGQKKLQHLNTPKYDVILNITDSTTMAITSFQSELGEVDIGMDEVNPSESQETPGPYDFLMVKNQHVRTFKKFKDKEWMRKFMGGKEQEYPLSPSPELDEFITWVDKNHDYLGWKPNYCMLSEGHPLRKCE
jgi:hypothetical protein